MALHRKQHDDKSYWIFFTLYSRKLSDVLITFWIADIAHLQNIQHALIIICVKLANHISKFLIWLIIGFGLGMHQRNFLVFLFFGNFVAISIYFRGWSVVPGFGILSLIKDNKDRGNERIHAIITSSDVLHAFCFSMKDFNYILCQPEVYVFSQSNRKT